MLTKEVERKETMETEHLSNVTLSNLFNEFISDVEHSLNNDSYLYIPEFRRFLEQLDQVISSLKVQYQPVYMYHLYKVNFIYRYSSILEEFTHYTEKGIHAN